MGRHPYLSPFRIAQLDICKYGHRNFSRTSSPWAVNRTPPNQLRGPQPRPTPTKSFRLEQRRSDIVSTDVGMLPGTFIAPSGTNRPTLIKDPRKALNLYWTRLKLKVQDFVVLLVYRWINRSTGMRLHSRQIAPTALALHKQMYTAFAEGDISTLKRICHGGLLDNFTARIHGRGNELVKWELVRYTKRPKIMSHRAVTLLKEGEGIRQAVVRICSTQSLTRYEPSGTIIRGSGKEKDVQEYLVLQKTMFRGKEGDWMIWGTTEETTPEKLEDERKALYE